MKLVKHRKYTDLLSPFKLKNIPLKNRIVKAAQWTVLCNDDGSVNDKIIAFYENLAKGGVGLITVEESICDYPLGASQVPHMRLDDDKFLPGLEKLALAIHQHDCPAIVQITHAGPAHSPLAGGQDPVAPSRLDPPVEPVFAVAKELSNEDIHKLVDKFVQAAVRVYKAGFDGVEMHMAHYAIGNAFLSRIQNKRSDEFGCQSVESRSLFGRMIIERVRENTSAEFVIGVRMNGREYGHELGTTIEEAIQFARIFKKAGVDFLQVSAYGYGAFALCALPELVTYPEIPPEVRDFANSIKHGALIDDAARIRKEADIVVSGVGFITPEKADDILKQDKVDMICFGRPLLVDPDLPNKLADNRFDEIRPCLRCNECLSSILLAHPVACRINPFLGKELNLPLKPTSTAKKIMIIGAGPAGLEAARVAAERGHHVLLYDQSRSLGGLVPMAAFIKGTKDIDDVSKLVTYYKNELSRLGVEIHLGKKVDEELVKKIKPDVIIAAPGGKLSPPPIKGIENKIVMTASDLKKRVDKYIHLFGSGMMSKLTKIFLPVGKKVVVLGGALASLETAEFLVKRGRQVTIIAEEENPGEGMPIVWLVRLLPWLAAKNVKIHTKAKILEISKKGIEFEAEGQKQKIGANNIIVIEENKINDNLFNKLKPLAKEAYLIGDAKGGPPSLIKGAISHGMETGLAI